MTLGAISGDTVSRTHRFKRPWFWVSKLVLLAGVAAFALSDEIRYVAGMTVVACTYGITSAEDVDKAAALEKAVISKTTSIHRFVHNSATQPDTPGKLDCSWKCRQARSGATIKASPDLARPHP